VLFSGAWGKMIHEKIGSKKFRDTVPLNKKMEIYVAHHQILALQNNEKLSSTPPNFLRF
jgi:hypothetical protein